jgi:hypothetical protein
MNSIEFLQTWYQSKCDGNWEHNFGISIETLDNPGWHIEVDLEDTGCNLKEIDELSEISDNDWFLIKTKDHKLVAAGDPFKLIYLLQRVQEILLEFESL